MHDEQFETGWDDGVSAFYRKIPCEWDMDSPNPYGQGYAAGYQYEAALMYEE